MNTNSQTISTVIDPSAWQQAVYAFLAEKERRSGSRRTVESYSRMLQHFFGVVGTTPDRVSSPEVLSWAHGIGLSGRQPSGVTVGAGKTLHTMQPDASLWQAGAGDRGVTSSTFYTRLRKYMVAAGRPPTGVHILRHTAAKLRRDPGESIESVSQPRASSFTLTGAANTPRRPSAICSPGTTCASLSAAHGNVGITLSPRASSPPSKPNSSTANRWPPSPPPARPSSNTSKSSTTANGSILPLAT